MLLEPEGTPGTNLTHGDPMVAILALLESWALMCLGLGCL